MIGKILFFFLYHYLLTKHRKAWKPEQPKVSDKDVYVFIPFNAKLLSILIWPYTDLYSLIYIAIRLSDMHFFISVSCWCLYVSVLEKFVSNSMKDSKTVLPNIFFESFNLVLMISKKTGTNNLAQGSNFGLQEPLKLLIG